MRYSATCSPCSMHAIRPSGIQSRSPHSTNRQGSSSRFAGILWMLYYHGCFFLLAVEPQAVSVDPCKPIPWLGRSLLAVNPAHVIISNSFPACHRGSQTTPRHTAGNGESKRESATDDYVV